jgi:spore coat protein CotH
MSFTELKQQAAGLPARQRRKLIAHLVALQTAKDESFKQELAAKIDDNEPAHWVELDELKKRYDE